jgi:hypothetical protein
MWGRIKREWKLAGEVWREDGCFGCGAAVFYAVAMGFLAIGGCGKQPW